MTTKAELINIIGQVDLSLVETEHERKERLEEAIDFLTTAVDTPNMIRSNWECEFIEDMAMKFARGDKFSDKQRDKIFELYRKHQ